MYNTHRLHDMLLQYYEIAQRNPLGVVIVNCCLLLIMMITVF